MESKILRLVLSMKQLLPDGYRTYNCQEIFDLHSNLRGKSEIEAKYEYVILARSLPTFGVHFFVVRVSPINE